jgi:hypothetical protein
MGSSTLPKRAASSASAASSPLHQPEGLLRAPELQKPPHRVEEVLELVGLGPKKFQVAAALGEALRQAEELRLLLEDHHPAGPRGTTLTQAGRPVGRGAPPPPPKPPWPAGPFPAQAIPFPGRAG